MSSEDIVEIDFLLNSVENRSFSDNLTETPTESVYSGVMSLKGLQIITFLAELNNLCLWATDVGYAYLESFTSEKIVFCAGPEFGDREGRKSSKRRNERLIRRLPPRQRRRRYLILVRVNQPKPCVFRDDTGIHS